MKHQEVCYSFGTGSSVGKLSLWWQVHQWFTMPASLRTRLSGMGRSKLMPLGRLFVWPSSCDRSFKASPSIPTKPHARPKASRKSKGVVSLCSFLLKFLMAVENFCLNQSGYAMHRSGKLFSK